ncbi:hypothetical protein J5N97_007718 [Dioscorea zingiberensis]|uniref:X8 domain-containing protein n=1 Tax=Dioscorea zingiberensis TaxID=325984 RepID=A0A9D5DGZ9_9LILI|nr:hypothetical protein J5N97_007718 [Dioscorea zingiberensis]
MSRSQRMAALSLLFLFLISSLCARADPHPQEKDGGGGVAGMPLWCVAKNNAEDSALQSALDWACGPGGADCAPIQPGGPCFQSRDVQSLASFAFNDYFRRRGSSPSDCDFAGCAALTSLDPSINNCRFPSSSSVGNGSFIGSTNTSLGSYGADMNGATSLLSSKSWEKVVKISLLLLAIGAVRMGSGGWFRTIINRKKTKHDKPKQSKGSVSDRPNGLKWKNHSHKGFNSLYRAASSVNPEDGITIKDIAAIRIQTAFRRFKARKTLRSLKGIKRLQVLSQTHPVKKQGTTTLNYIQSWSKIQMEIRARRACMVAEGRIKQKKLDNQLKLEAKLHDLQVEWCGGSDTMEEILTRIQQREEAAVKRERAMAYAFSHQWRANQSQGPLVYEVGKGNWGWSWMERWIAARPWESRLPYQSFSPNKAQKKAGGSKVAKNTNSTTRGISSSGKTSASDGKGSTNKKTLESSDNKTVDQEPNPKPKTKNGKQDQQLQPHISDNAG